MKFAYADPPYIGQAKKRYSHDPLCAEVNHQDLIAMLMSEYPDGWALSLSSPSLKQILALAPDTARVMAWIKPFCAFKANVNPAYAWEPVIVNGGRKRDRDVATVRDFHSANISLQKGLCGAKPESFCHWICDVLGAQPEDEMHDIYPGTGVMGMVWEERKNFTTYRGEYSQPLQETLGGWR